ncbi:hypothetical protein N7470_002438 [Penicillium chermesinum]|nr:hypothetical protein N7470_002438 [Penicillium chermesinum]
MSEVPQTSAFRERPQTMWSPTMSVTSSHSAASRSSAVLLPDTNVLVKRPSDGLVNRSTNSSSGHDPLSAPTTNPRFSKIQVKSLRRDVGADLPTLPTDSRQVSRTISSVRGSPEHDQRYRLKALRCPDRTESCGAPEHDPGRESQFFGRLVMSTSVGDSRWRSRALDMMLPGSALSGMRQPAGCKTSDKSMKRGIPSANSLETRTTAVSLGVGKARRTGIPQSSSPVHTRPYVPFVGLGESQKRSTTLPTKEAHSAVSPRPERSGQVSFRQRDCASTGCSLLLEPAYRPLVEEMACSK